jgi:hypothetical protein
MFVDHQSSKFSRFNFVDTHDHAHYTLYNHAYFVGLFSQMDSNFSAKIRALEISRYIMVSVLTIKEEKTVP